MDHFSHIHVVKLCCRFKRPKYINQTEVGDGPLKRDGILLNSVHMRDGKNERDEEFVL